MNMTFQDMCVEYLTEARAAHDHALATDELSLRPALDAFLKHAAAHFERSVAFLSEAKKVSAGRPDFTATVNGLPIGYVEAEAFGVNLDKLTGHAKEQNDRFRANLDNFLLTNHLEFRLYLGGEQVGEARLPDPAAQKTIQVSAADAEQLATLLTRFLRGEWARIASPRELAVHLARRTRQLRNEVVSILRDPAAKQGEICEHYEAVKAALLPDVSAEQFAGLYAQTIVYGLFAARCMTDSGAVFTRDAAAKLVPKTNPFLRKLFQRIAALDLDDRVAWIADDAAQLLGKAQMADILADFGQRAGKEDPVVHFYETFLAEYDPAVREIRGVYYTPEPVVSYIVRSLDYLLKTRLNKPNGLADDETLILDPATGTGSFLFEVVKQIHQTITRAAAGAWSDYVERKLLPRLFGFELLMAPYAVAHLKLGLLLQQLHYTFQDKQRLGIYLTNTLENAVRRTDVLMSRFIVEEAEEAAAIKRDRQILVVLGNPPYSGHSANRSETTEFVPPGQPYVTDSASGLRVTRKTGKNGVTLTRKTFIGKLIEDYKLVDGKPLGEQNPKLLQDDYVKFIRFAQWRIERTGEGLIGFITNHGYLDNPTFRGMRQSLMQTFSEIYVYNLHGNARKRETAPDGGNDENVFEIQQGVAILLCVKQTSQKQPARIYHADAWGVQQNKYDILRQSSVQTTAWQLLQPRPPFYLFVPHDVRLLPEYDQGWKVTEIMPVFSTGIKTHRDHFAIDFDEVVLRKRIADFRNLSVSDDEIARKYNLRDTRDWKLSEKRRIVAANAYWENYFAICLYRPFDFRACYHHKDVIELPRHEVVYHLLRKKNLALITTRQTRDQWDAFAAKHIANHKSCAAYDTNSVFPLYLYPEQINGQITTENGRRPNFSPAFLKALAEKLHLKPQGEFGMPEGISPEDIFHYAYAVFHSPTYRERYAEFLKIDFPRLPLTSDLELFRDLAELGRQLVALHLLDAQAAPVLQNAISPFPIAPADAKHGSVVETVTYDDETRRVFINKTQYFEDVPPEVWNFHVGGYQVCEKWLKDRKGRALTFDDIQQYQKIVVALAETLRLMTAIDERIQGFPLT